jgi:hypothetical protein
LIVVQGSPGSGKSVALRHVALRLAKQAKENPHPKSRLPGYVNLRDLHRAEHQPINGALIRAFVREQLSNNNTHITEFLDENLGTDLREGSWLFLFDSFDEIPDILSSVDADQTVLEYSRAINDFFSGPNVCRGIVASRSYRRPHYERWTTFRILPLSESRQRELVKLVFDFKSLGIRALDDFFGELAVASPDIQFF